MKKSAVFAILAAISLSWLVYTAVAQGPAGGVAPAPGAGTRIAMLDVSQIFKNHVRFKGMMEDMKADVQRAEGQIRAEREAIGKLEQRLQEEFHKGTPDYKNLEEEIARRKAELTLKVQMQGREFQQRQAKIYYSVYQEISQASDYFCRQHAIDIVLQYKQDNVDPDVAESVIPHINKQIVWYDKGLDITGAILQELNRSAPNPRAADLRGAPAAPAAPYGNNPNR